MKRLRVRRNPLPRKSKLRGKKARLELRRQVFDSHGAFPINNPGKAVPPMELHRPGSMNK